jgi:predicted transcriptional regulator YheO
VVLHEVSHPENSIIKIRNGHVTGRKDGAPLTNLALEMIKDSEKGMEVLGNYHPKTKNGSLLKSNALNIKDPNGNLVGILCINLDVSQYLKMEHTLQQMGQTMKDFYSVKEEPEAKVIEEHFGTELWSIIQGMIDERIREKGKPVMSFSIEERLEVIKKLNEKGIFYAKGAIRHVAKSLGLSVSSIYRYLEELRLEVRVSPPSSTEKEMA